MSARRGTRSLIAGDDKQFPPIIQAVYPDPERASRCCTVRFLNASGAQDPDCRYTATLLENWRMSARSASTRPSRSTLSEYRSATQDIATDGWLWRGHRP